MSTLYAYKNKLWKVKETFTYTGSPESFQLNPGKYLLICNGAHGGRCQRNIIPANEGYNYGGTSYGVLNLTETKQLYAVVGGNGGDAGSIAADPPGAGGYNGGATGGTAYDSRFLNGAGGGGASDIRTSLDPTIPTVTETLYLPTGYQRLDYIETDGVNNFDTQTPFGLGRIDVDMVVTELPSSDAKFGFNTANSGNFIGVRSTGQFFKSETNSTALATSRHSVSLVRSVVDNENTAEIIIDSSEVLDDIGMTVIDIDSLVAGGNYSWQNWAYYNETGDDGTGWGNWIITPGIPNPNPGGIVQFNFTSGTSGTFINQLTNPTSGNFGGCAVVTSTGTGWNGWHTSGSTFQTSPNANYLRPNICAGQNNAGPLPTNASIVAGGTTFDFDSSFIFNNPLKMKIYGLVFYNENNGVEHYFIPCVNSSNVVGMYDLMTDEFVGDTNLIAGNSIPDTGTAIKTTTIKIIKTLPDDCDELEYIQSDGNQYIDTGYICKSNTRIECICEILDSNISYQTVFGAQTGMWWANGIAFFARYNYSSTTCGLRIGPSDTTGTGFLYNQKVKLIVENGEAKWYNMQNQYIGSIITGRPQPDTEYTMLLFALHEGEAERGYRSAMKLYSLKFITDEKLLHQYVPCKNNSNNSIGMYDVMEDKFYPSKTAYAFIPGNVTTKHEYSYRIKNTMTNTMLSRIIVAGGGGGQHNTYTGYNADGFRTWASMGGGIVGGPIMCNPLDSADFEKYASQTNGYDFGYGQVPAKAGAGDNNTEGRGGGGGGWYGGFAMQNNSAYTHNDGSGGGGSGYVLTASSYKPLGYLNGPEFYLTDTFMSAGHAESASVIICEEVSNIHSGDIIIVPPTGETCHFSIPAGQYVLKCWGGMGGINKNTSYAVRGGYTQGTLSIESGCEIYCNVGGSGIGDSLISPAYVHQFRPEINFNGGGAPGVYGTYARSNGKSGGGATDIRIGSNSLYARVIVAGGSGGQGDSEYVAGVGGGTTGGSPSSGYGDNAGPGSQTETPHNTYSYQYPTIAGDFGYGGNAYNHSSGWSGGAGGGGWFGGNGTYPTRDGTKGGTGGSGYVFTESSYKPTGYLLNSDYYLTDTTMTSGGNNLHLGETKIEIDVVSATNSRILCRDSDGLKAFDENANRWIVISESLTIETFQTYGSIYMSTDAGLRDEYEILVYDPENSFDKAGLTVSPKKQTVTHTIISQMTIARNNMIYEYDPDEYDVNMSFIRIPNGERSQIVTTVELDKLDPYAVTTPKVYYAQYINRK
jgi:hypothetical protein